MKKIIIGFLLVIVIIVGIFAVWYNQNISKLRDIREFNSEFDGFLNRKITGVDITTIMNKAIELNSKNNVQKDQNGAYQENDNSIEIFVKPTLDGNYYKMEAYDKVGMREFTKSFGGLIFQSSKVEYHKNGKISQIYFEVKEKPSTSTGNTIDNTSSNTSNEITNEITNETNNEVSNTTNTTN